MFSLSVRERFNSQVSHMSYERLNKIV